MTTEEEHMLELINSLADLTQKQNLMIYELTQQNAELQAQVDAIRAIAKAKL